MQEHFIDEPIQSSVTACSEALLPHYLHHFWSEKMKNSEKQGWARDSKGIALPDCILHAAKDANAGFETIQLFRKEVMKERGEKKDRKKPVQPAKKTSRKRTHEEDSDYCECCVFCQQIWLQVQTFGLF